MRRPFAILACSMFLNACAHPVVTPERPKHAVLLKFVLAADVPDSTVVCVTLTIPQQMAHPLLIQPMCRWTVGEMRGLFLEQQQVRMEER